MPPPTELYSNVGIAADPPLAAGISSGATTITFSSTTVVSHFPTAVAGTSQFRALIYEDTNADGQADKAELVLVTAGGAGSTSWTITRAYEMIGGQQSAFAFSTAALVAPILSSGGHANLPGVASDFALTSGRHLVMPGGYYPTSTTPDWRVLSSASTALATTNEGIRLACLQYFFTEQGNVNQAGITLDHMLRWMFIDSYPVTATGSGYATAPAVTVSAPESGGVQAYAVSILSGGTVVGITPATGASATAAVDTAGTITGLSALVGGSNFPPSLTGITVVLEQNGNRSGRATVNTSAGGVATSVTLTAGGLGYTAGSVTIDTRGQYARDATATLSGGGGSGATTNVSMSLISRTGLHIKTFVPPDNGSESSGLLVNATGGSNAYTGYRLTQMRPSGTWNYWDSTQPAMEISHDTAAAGILAASGAGAGQNETTTTTDNPLSSGATTVNVASTAADSWRTSVISGRVYFKIDNEYMYATGMTGTSFTGVVRGITSTAASHAVGSTVRLTPPGQALWVRMERPIDKGVVATPGDGVFDAREAFAAGGHFHGSHLNQLRTWYVLLNGYQYGRSLWLEGSGQASGYTGQAGFNDNGVVTLNDTGSGVGGGGMLQVAFAGQPFGAIKGSVTDGAGLGHLLFLNRLSTGSTWTYSEAMRIQSNTTWVGFNGQVPSAAVHVGGAITTGVAFAVTTDVTNANGVQLTPQLSLSAGNVSILSSQARLNPTAALATNVYGFLSIPTIGPASGAANSNTFSLARVVNMYSATATATAYGGTIAEVLDYHAGGMSLGTSSTATVTRQIGFYCGLLPTKNIAGTGGPAEQSWAMYAEGRAASPAAGDRGNPSYFGDFIRAWDVEQYGTFVRYGIQVNRNANTVVAVATALTASLVGTATFVDTTSGGVLNLATTAVNGNIASAALSSFSQTKFQWGPVFTTNLQIPDITSVRVWAGLFSAAVTNTDTPSTLSVAAFRFSTAASDTTWRAVTSNATTATVHTSVNAVTVAANTRYLLRVDGSDTVNWRFYVNGLLVASTNVTPPAATTFLGAHIAIATQTTAARNIRFGAMFIAEE